MQSKNKNLSQWFLVAGLLVFLALSFLSRAPSTEEAEMEATKNIKIAGVALSVEVAITPEARSQGLSYRSELSEGDSMLFVFDEPGVYPFWMKDMNFTIDIIWIGEDKRVVYIKENATPESYPESFKPEQKAKYVLETVAGFSAKNNLKVGDRVQFDF